MPNAVRVSPVRPLLPDPASVRVAAHMPRGSQPPGSRNLLPQQTVFFLGLWGRGRGEAPETSSDLQRRHRSGSPARSESGRWMVSLPRLAEGQGMGTNDHLHSLRKEARGRAPRRRQCQALAEVPLPLTRCLHTVVLTGCAQGEFSKKGHFGTAITRPRSLGGLR